jgi:hypothetical protein
MGEQHELQGREGREKAVVVEDEVEVEVESKVGVVMEAKMDEEDEKGRRRGRGRLKEGYEGSDGRMTKEGVIRRRQDERGRINNARAYEGAEGRRGDGERGGG